MSWRTSIESYLNSRDETSVEQLGTRENTTRSCVFPSSQRRLNFLFSPDVERVAADRFHRDDRVKQNIEDTFGSERRFFPGIFSKAANWPNVRRRWFCWDAFWRKFLKIIWKQTKVRDGTKRDESFFTDHHLVNHLLTFVTAKMRDHHILAQPAVDLFHVLVTAFGFAGVFPLQLVCLSSGQTIGH